MLYTKVWRLIKKNAFIHVKDQNVVSLTLKYKNVQTVRATYHTFFFLWNELVFLIRPQNLGQVIQILGSVLNKDTGISWAPNATILAEALWKKYAGVGQDIHLSQTENKTFGKERSFSL